MAVTIRPDLAEIPDYLPGRKIPGAVVLSSNEMPAPPPAPILAAINAAAREVNRYPAMACDELVTRLASRCGVDTAQVAVGCGSVSLCHQLIQATCAPGDDVVFAWRSFEAYPILTQIVGARPVPIPLAPGHRLNLDAMLEAITPATRLVLISNPNSPTGTALRHGALERFLDTAPDTVLVVLDEAYREFVTDPDVPDGVHLATGRDNVAVLRTFSKTYSLAGARVGYCIAPPAVAAAARKVGIPFAVSHLAQAAALAALDTDDEFLTRCTEITHERDRLRTELRAAGYPVPESQANCLWLPLGQHTQAFTEHCADHNVIVRPFADDGVRVTIGLPIENNTFLAAARTAPPSSRP